MTDEEHIPWGALLKKVMPWLLAGGVGTGGTLGGVEVYERLARVEVNQDRLLEMQNRMLDEQTMQRELMMDLHMVSQPSEGDR